MALARSRVLTAEAEQRLAEARHLLGDLRELLARLPASDEELRTLAASIRQLDELFLIVVAGEFNAGKSALINALLGQRILEEGVTPTTSRIQLVRHGDQPSASTDATGVHVVAAPVEILRDLHIVDTPGTNAIMREHERLTRDFVPRADLVLFVTSADHPFTETERAFLDTIRDWGKKIVLVVNKADIFDAPEGLAEVVTFVRDAALRLLGITPDVFAVSARLAWRARHGEPEVWERSGFEALERFVRDTLDEESRFQLKLANPLGVGDALARRYEEIARARLALVAGDAEVIDDVERQLVVYGEDLDRGFELRMTAVEKVLVDLESRGHAFLDDTLRIGRVFDLLSRSRIQQEFEARVVGDAPALVERRVSELVDWLIEQDLRQWQALSARLAARQREHGDRMLGADGGVFHADRAALIDSVGREAQRVVDTYDHRRESRELADGARSAVAATAAVGAGALGLGAILSVVATTAAADVSGVLAAGVLGAMGLLILPAKRRHAREELRGKITDLRERLSAALRGEFETARSRGAQRLADGMAPYTRFVRAEQRKWTEAREALGGWRTRAGALGAGS